jgi:hypothetical protein
LRRTYLGEVEGQSPAPAEFKGTIKTYEGAAYPLKVAWLKEPKPKGIKARNV